MRLTMLLLMACAPATELTNDAGLLSDGGVDPLVDEMLRAHNAVRARAMPAPMPALPPMTFNFAASEKARVWAANCDFMHNPNHDPFGENIAWGTGPALSPTDVTELWAAEVSDYDYAHDTCASGQMCGHYTQIVWRGTTSVGCSRAQCGNTWFWVCDYFPAGNVIGQRPY
jgi:pathogenesis-related protein 1